MKPRRLHTTASREARVYHTAPFGQRSARDSRSRNVYRNVFRTILCYRSAISAATGGATREGFVNTRVSVLAYICAGVHPRAGA